jgi:hypothetical protein
MSKVSEYACAKSSIADGSPWRAIFALWWDFGAVNLLVARRFYSRIATAHTKILKIFV